MQVLPGWEAGGLLPGRGGGPPRCGGTTLFCGVLQWERGDPKTKMYGDSGLLRVDLEYLKTKLVLPFSSVASRPSS